MVAVAVVGRAKAAMLLLMRSAAVRRGGGDGGGYGGGRGGLVRLLSPLMLCHRCSSQTAPAMATTLQPGALCKQPCNKSSSKEVEKWHVDKGADAKRIWPVTLPAGLCAGAMTGMPAVALCAAGGTPITTATVTTAAGFTIPTALLTLLQVSGPAFFLSLQLSGSVATRQIIKEKSVGKLSILPSLSLFTNCVIWTWYGHLIGDMTVMLPNVSGAIFGAAYTAVYLKYTTQSQAKLLAGSSAIIAAVTGAALALPTEQVVPYIGLTGDVLAVILMASPLATIRTVLAEKSTKAMPFATSLATFFNGACWSGYGFVVMGDPLIWVPNALGFLAASVQMTMFMRFGIHRGD
ncbi:hypothetical protein PTSG_08897 [Salpingoeca rosetta]|uniref:Sugar transporter SWEET1 n=1 Tax=Salpingoeca rosetta (strain ATCC 50818 / BSB-021) TaxID=946362 RepID=F2UL08_SALR5|nr:uncharacterized protein PTSG_08897 [Salpingoeca rosetta]EGD77807.1 hypothetical protein PTSG_08897 [Salpingoeca rosetta]|eukprot:XP_004990283.1 hypothetical protein PTSG_08897 [Salpingoeca rosetta]